MILFRILGQHATHQREYASFFRDVYDYTVHAIDIIETFRDIVSGILGIYLSSVSLKLNEVMKVLTIVGTIFLPLAFIASLRMNFRDQR